MYLRLYRPRLGFVMTDRGPLPSFLVDVDGVLVHEEHAIPGTNRSIQALRLPTSRS
jgi:ribonucleotide monophosphatase NagD (HAD superfamily)